LNAASQLELLLQAGEILSLSWPNKICGVLMDNEICDIIEKVSPLFEKSHHRYNGIFGPEYTDPKYDTRVTIAICYPTTQFST
jgi:hypothetical protein